MKRVQIVITLFIGGCNVTHIYLPSGPTCYAIAAHELGHVYGVPGLDRPTVGINW